MDTARPGAPRSILQDGAGNLIVFSEEVVCNGNRDVGVVVRSFSGAQGAIEIWKSEFCQNAPLQFLSATIDLIPNFVYLAYTTTAESIDNQTTRVLRLTGIAGGPQSNTTFSVLPTAGSLPAILTLADVRTSFGYDLSIWMLARDQLVTVLGGEGPTSSLEMTLPQEQGVVDGVVSGNAMYTVGTYAAVRTGSKVIPGGIFLRQTWMGGQIPTTEVRVPQSGLDIAGEASVRVGGASNNATVPLLRKSVVACGDYVYFFFVSARTGMGLSVTVHDIANFSKMRRSDLMQGTDTFLWATCLDNTTTSAAYSSNTPPSILLLATNGSTSSSSGGDQYLLLVDAANLTATHRVPIPPSTTTTTINGKDTPLPYIASAVLPVRG
ncbi:hypothetical protein HK104_006914, partial [Borealophlyctis nickersoniae]